MTIQRYYIDCEGDLMCDNDGEVCEWIDVRDEFENQSKRIKDLENLCKRIVEMEGKREWNAFEIICTAKELLSNKRIK